jgi:hypothetical protein
MTSRILSRNNILAFVCALVVVILYSSGVFAQGTASIKALFGQETPTVSAPADPATPEIK